MKANALARCDLPDEITMKPWHTKPKLIDFPKGTMTILGHWLCCRPGGGNRLSIRRFPDAAT